MLHISKWISFNSYIFLLTSAFDLIQVLRYLMSFLWFYMVVFLWASIQISTLGFAVISLSGLKFLLHYIWYEVAACETLQLDVIHKRRWGSERASKADKHTVVHIRLETKSLPFFTLYFKVRWSFCTMLYTTQKRMISSARMCISLFSFWSWSIFRSIKWKVNKEKWPSPKAPSLCLLCDLLSNVIRLSKEEYLFYKTICCFRSFSFLLVFRH